jgi:tRNA pseudouridine55 synthase
VGVEGILNVHKPAGISSFGVVARIKQTSGEKQVGHAGTLDPLASGVLPIFLGSATRAMEYLSEHSKTYRAEVALGITTDSYDSEGSVTSSCDPSSVRREDLEEALAKFRGTIQQTPPMFSALKQGGQPLYRLARQGLEVPRAARPVQIYSLEIVAWENPIVTLEISCSKGTYIRALAHDLGQALGCGAHLKTLVRLKVGPFSLEDALTLGQIREISSAGQLEEHLYPVDFVLSQFPALIVRRQQGCSLIHGAAIKTSQVLNSSLLTHERPLARVYTEQGTFLGLLCYNPERELWQPDKIFARECPGCGSG